MARAKPERSRSKTAAIDDLTQSIEQLQAFLPQVEDLGREGFPYLEGARARTELRLRECIKHAFGEKSQEYQTHRHHKLSVGSSAETKHTVTLIKILIAMLEDKKLELQGLKSASSEEPSVASTPLPPARPQMTLVPPTTPTATVTIASAAQVTPPPITMSVPLATNVDIRTAVSAPSNVQPTTQAAPMSPPTPPMEQTVPQPVTAGPSSSPSTQPVAPEPVASLLNTQETKPLAPPAPQSQPPIPRPSQNPHPKPASEPTPHALVLSDVPPPTTPPRPLTVPSPGSDRMPIAESVLPASALSTAPPTTTPLQFSATQEIPLPQQPDTAHATSTAPTSTTLGPSPVVADYLDLTRKLCQRFHAVARQLRLRGEYRATLTVEDECDAQDLFHALLRLQFDDIGTDEWTPGYTNGALRTTFLLNHDRLAITVKKTRPGLSAKDLAEQVRVDIERYRAREHCSNLFCFIYDPDGRIGNPRGLEKDLTAVNDDLTVNVLVAPK